MAWKPKPPDWPVAHANPHPPRGPDSRGYLAYGIGHVTCPRASQRFSWSLGPRSLWCPLRGPASHLFARQTSDECVALTLV